MNEHSWQSVIDSITAGVPGHYDDFERPNEIAVRNALAWCNANTHCDPPQRVHGCDGVVCERYREDKRLEWYVEFDNDGSIRHSRWNGTEYEVSSMEHTR